MGNVLRRLLPARLATCRTPTKVYDRSNPFGPRPLFPNRRFRETDARTRPYLWAGRSERHPLNYYGAKGFYGFAYKPT